MSLITCKRLLACEGSVTQDVTAAALPTGSSVCPQTHMSMSVSDIINAMNSY